MDESENIGEIALPPTVPDKNLNLPLKRQEGGGTRKRNSQEEEEPFT